MATESLTHIVIGAGAFGTATGYWLARKGGGPVLAAQARPLILTSNRPPAEWYALFPNPVVAESLLDRLINTSHQALMDGPSYRPRKRPRPSDSTTTQKPEETQRTDHARGIA